MRPLFFALAAVVLLASNVPAFGQIVVYSDRSNLTNTIFANGGAATVGGNTITRMIADDIHIDPIYAGRSVNLGLWSIANPSSGYGGGPIRYRARYWANDGPAGAPGTLLASSDFTHFAPPPGTAIGFGVSTGFVVPANGLIWAGIAFDNNDGAINVTAAQLNTIGQIVCGPATVGSSDDLFFVSSTAGDFAVNNPAGLILNSPFGGSPVGNLYWEVQIAPVPEPSSMILVGIALFGGAMRLRRGRAANRLRIVAGNQTFQLLHPASST